MNQTFIPARQVWTVFIEICDRLRENAFLAQSATQTELLLSLTGRQQKILKTVHALTASRPEGIPLKELAETLAISPGTTSEAVENMVRAGTLQRSVCASDRRAVRIRLSESGRKIITVGQEKLDHLTEAFLRDLSPEEKQQFFQLLERFAVQLQPLTASSSPPPRV